MSIRLTNAYSFILIMISWLGIYVLRLEGQYKISLARSGKTLIFLLIIFTSGIAAKMLHSNAQLQSNKAKTLRKILLVLSYLTFGPLILMFLIYLGFRDFGF